MTEMVFDHAGRYLYVTVPGGLVRRYDLTSGQFDLSYNPGGSVSSLDIAPDDSCLLVTQDIPTGQQAIVHRINLASGTVTNVSYDLAFYDEVGAWSVRFAANGLAFLTGNLQCCASGALPLRQIDLATNTVSNRADVANGVMFASSIARSADATRLYICQPQVSNNPVLTYNAATNTFSPVTSTYLPLSYNTNAVNRNGTLLATSLWEYGVSLDEAADFSYVHNFPAPDQNVESSVAFDSVTDTLYWAKSTTGQLIAYDTNTFAEKFRWDIGEYVGPAGAYWNPLVASPNGRYVALGTQSGVRLFSVPGTPRPPDVIPTVHYRRRMVFDHTGQHLYIATSAGVVQRFTVPEGRLDKVYNVGGWAWGIDIASDDSYLLIGQQTAGIATGVFQKIDVNSGAITTFSYMRDAPQLDAGSWDVRIASNGLAIGEVGGGSGGIHALRQIDLSTGQVTQRSEFGNSQSAAQIIASNDRNWLFVLGGPAAYNALTNSFSVGHISTYPANDSALSRDGTLFANLQQPGVILFTGAPDFSNRHTFSQLNSGIAFDPNQDVLYGVDSTSSTVVAYDTNTFAELFRIPIGETMDASSGVSSGAMMASPDGRYLALYTPTTVRLIDLTTRTAFPMDVPQVYTVYLSASPPNSGAVVGAGTFPGKSMVTVTASPSSGYQFENWTENGSMVSASASYQFAINSDRSLVANFAPLVSAPTISPNGGTFRKKVTVTLFCATASATIYYTTDGTDPTTASTVYNNASGKKKAKGIKLAGIGAHTVKAKAVKSGYHDSAIATANFTIN